MLYMYLLTLKKFSKKIRYFLCKVLLFLCTYYTSDFVLFHYCVYTINCISVDPCPRQKEQNAFIVVLMLVVGIQFGMFSNKAI